MLCRKYINKTKQKWKAIENKYNKTIYSKSKSTSNLSDESALCHTWLATPLGVTQVGVAALRTGGWTQVTVTITVYVQGFILFLTHLQRSCLICHNRPQVPYVNFLIITLSPYPISHCTCFLIMGKIHNVRCMYIRHNECLQSEPLKIIFLIRFCDL